MPALCQDVAITYQISVPRAKSIAAIVDLAVTLSPHVIYQYQRVRLITPVSNMLHTDFKRVWPACVNTYRARAL